MLLAQGKATTDNKLKAQLYQRVDSINHERGPFATFWQIGYLVGARSSVKNLTIHGGRFFWYFNIIKE
jgi:ABC-type transport system substrate-binding protein